MVSGFTLFFSVLISIAQFGNNKAYDTENDHDRDQNTQHRTQKHNHDCSDQDNGKLAIPGTKIDVKTTAPRPSSHLQLHYTYVPGPT